jgi:AbrB family looped-hinge helix DNA binding protein
MARSRTATVATPTRPTLVRLTPSGQVSIPKPIRDSRGYAAGDFFTIEPTTDGVILRRQIITPDPDRQAYLNAKAGIGLSPVFDRADAFLADLHRKTGRKPSPASRRKRKK